MPPDCSTRCAGRRNPAKKGFTLVELLTVIVIVGILSAILIPVTAKVRESARLAKCKVNLRSIWLGMELYANANRGNYPTASSNTKYAPGRDFMDRLTRAGFLEDNTEGGFCPSDPIVKDGHAQISQGPRSYFLTSPGMCPKFTATERRNRSAFQNPARTAAIVEYHYNGKVRARDLGTADFGVASDIVSDDERAADTTHHANGYRNAVFADGHVAFVSPTEIRKNSPNAADFWGTKIDY